MNSNIKTKTTAAPLSQTPAPQPPQAELLTQVQMAQRLGITRRTLHTWVQEGTVPMIKVRGYCRFEPAKVWAALLRCEVPAASAAKSSSSSYSSSSSRKGALSAAATPNA